MREWMQVADLLSTDGTEWAVQAAFAQAVMVQRNKLPFEHLKAARCPAPSSEFCVSRVLPPPYKINKKTKQGPDH